MKSMVNKSILYIYVSALVMILMTLVVCLPNSVTTLYAICALILLYMMVALEYLAFGMGNRFLLDVVIMIGLTIGIVIGINNNPHLNEQITNMTLVSFIIIVLSSTYRAMKRK